MSAIDLVSTSTTTIGYQTIFGCGIPLQLAYQNIFVVVLEYEKWYQSIEDCDITTQQRQVEFNFYSHRDNN